MKIFTTISVIIGLSGLLIGSNQADGQTKVGRASMMFLNISNSPEMNGMGRCGINIVNEQSAMHNPGAMGRFFLDKVFTVSLPSKTEWITDDDYIKSYSIGGGLHSDLILKLANGKFNAGMGIVFSKMELDYGNLIRRDATDDSLGIFSVNDKANFVSIGFGIEYYIRLGLGMSFKDIKSVIDNYKTETTARDFGIYLEIPVCDILPINSNLSQKGKELTLDATPSFAYVKRNIGDGVYYIDATQKDPIPENSKLGFTLYLGADYKKAKLASLTLVYESEKDLVVKENKRTNQFGVELSLIDFLDLRAGNYEDKSGRVDHATYGCGLNLRGIVAWLAALKVIDGEIGTYVAEHLDLSFNFATYVDDDGFLDSTKFWNLSFSI